MLKGELRHGGNAGAGETSTQQAVPITTIAQRGGRFISGISPSGTANARESSPRVFPRLSREAKTGATAKEMKMPRPYYQRGSVYGPYRAHGERVFKVRFRVRNAAGMEVNRQETLRVSSKKEARSILDQKIRDSQNREPAVTEMTVATFIEKYWRPYMKRRGIKDSSLSGYESSLRQVLPTLGDFRLADVTPLNIEEIAQKKLNDGSSTKTVRNLLGFLGCIFALAMDHDLIQRSPVRRMHKPKVVRTEKTSWSAQQIRSIIDAAPAQHRCLFVTLALSGA